MSNIGDKIKQARIKKDLKQADLAKLIGVANTTISGWENGVSRPDVDMIEILCGALEVPAEYFFDVKSSDNAPCFTIMEFEVIKKYRSLDDYGKKAVDSILDVESERVSNTIHFYGAARGGDKIKGEITEQDAKEIMDYVKKVQKDIPEF